MYRIITGELLKILEYLQKVRIRTEDKKNLDIVNGELKKLMNIIDSKIFPLFDKCITSIRGNQLAESDNESGVDRLLKLMNKLSEIKAEAILYGGLDSIFEDDKLSLDDTFAEHEVNTAIASQLPPVSTAVLRFISL